ncbi:sugar 3,4-ketoisomerase [Pirellulaceae bacterium SH501]
MRPILQGSFLFDIPRLADGRGELSFIQHPDHIPFLVSRAYFLYNVTENASRGFHAHRKLQQAMIAVSGSVDIILDDGISREKVTLNRPDQCLLVGRRFWREMENFSDRTVLLVLASCPYEESDYIRDYGEFLRLVKEVEE